MRYVDLIVQSLMILYFAIAVPFGWVLSGELMLGAMVAQFVVGCWQMASSLISILASAPYTRQKQVHFLTAIVYIIVLVILGSSGWDLPDYLLIAAFTVPAWFMAGWYYYMTWRRVFEKRSKGRFLPHVFL